MSSHPRRAGAAPRWTAVDQLSELARCLLSEDLGGRDVVPAAVADRVTALAAQWADHGFTPQTVRPWADLTPACGAYLAGRGVDPAALEQLIDAGAPAGPVTLRQAILTGQLDAEQAYEVVSSRTTPTPTPPGPPPAVFSHSAADHPSTHAADRTADRAADRRTSNQPSRTPFRT
jgi:hypothetical protein